MDHLDYRAQADSAGTAVIAEASRQQQERRTQPLAAATEQVPANLCHWFDGRAVLADNLLLDLGQVVADQVEDLLGG